MGQPISHGFPDWGRQQAPTDVILLSQTTFNMAASVVLFEGFVGTAPYLQVNAFNDPGNRGRIEFQWYADAALTVFLYSQFMHLAPSGAYGGSVPIAAPFVKVIATAAAFPQTLTVAIITGVAYTSRMSLAGGIPILVSQVGVAVGAGATVAADSTFTVPGLAHWSVDTALATWTARLEALDMAGTVFQLASTRNTALPGIHLVYLPLMPVRVSFTNTTGAAGAFDSQVVARSFGPS